MLAITTTVETLPPSYLPLSLQAMFIPIRQLKPPSKSFGVTPLDCAEFSLIVMGYTWTETVWEDIPREDIK